MADIVLVTAQLFDKDNANSIDAYFNTSNPTVISSSSSKCIYIPCKANTTYTVNKMASSRFYVGSCSELPQFGTTINNVVGGNDYGPPLSITTSSNDNYLIAFVYRTADSMTFSELCDTIMINEGQTALPYAAYRPHSLKKFDGTNWIDAAVKEYDGTNWN